MRIIYSAKKTKTFWDDYWRGIKKDPDKLTSPEDYPLFPICQEIRPHHKIAEIGCGMGRFYKHYHFAGYDIIGVDYVEEAVNLLKKENPEFNVYAGNVLSLDLPDNTYDIVTAFGTLGNLKNPEEVKRGFKELVRIAKPGGLICASLNPDNLGAKILNFINTFGVSSQEREQYILTFDKAEVLAIAKEFDVVPVKTVSLYSKVHFYRIVFLRWPHKKLPIDNLRDGEQGYRLNFFGETVFNFFKVFFPNTLSHVNVFIFRKHEENKR